MTKYGLFEPDWDLVVEHFDVDETSDPDDILRYVLAEGYYDHDSTFTADDFFNLLYHQSPIVQSATEKLYRNVHSGYKYHAVHGYGRNGKTTFLKHFSYYLKNNKRETHRFHTFNFSPGKEISKRGATLADSSIKRIFLEVVKMHDNVSEACQSIIEFVEFYQTTSRNNASNEPGLTSAKRSEFFEEFDRKIALICSKTLGLESEYDEKEDYFRKEVKKLIRTFTRKEHAGEILCFLIGWVIFKNKDIFELNKLKPSSKSKMIFIFDNLDELFSTISQTLAKDYIFLIYDFIKVFSRGNVRAKIPGYSQSDVVFIFAMRSANLVNSYKLFVSDTTAAPRDVHFDTLNKFPVYLISSVSDSHLILQKRLSLFESICDKLDIQDRGELYKFFLNFISISFPDQNPKRRHLFKEPEQKDIKRKKKRDWNLFRLWNGNNTFLKDILNPKEIEHLNERFDRLGKRGKFLKRGTMLSFFLRDFLEISTNNSVSDTIRYFFNSSLVDIENSRCSLKRLFLNIVVNHVSNGEKRVVKRFSDIKNGGVDLLTVLEKIYLLNDPEISLKYSEADVKELFRHIFHDRIDEWGHIITCTKKAQYIVQNATPSDGKPTLDTSKKEEAYRISLDEEIHLFFKMKNGNLPTSEKTNLEDRLMNIKLFYNDSGYYMIDVILSHFEYFSMRYSRGKNIPLLLTTSDIIYDTEKERYTFGFEPIIENVINEVRKCLSITVQYYNSVLYDRFAICDFEVSEYTHGDSFFFDEVISQHISYLIDIRKCIIDTDLLARASNSSEMKIKQQANSLILDFISEYITLFEELYKKVQSRSNTKEINYSKLYRTKDALLAMRGNIGGINRGSIAPFAPLD